MYGQVTFYVYWVSLNTDFTLNPKILKAQSEEVYVILDKYTPHDGNSGTTVTLWSDVK